MENSIINKYLLQHTIDLITKDCKLFQEISDYHSRKLELSEKRILTCNETLAKLKEMTRKYQE